ncbi:MAG: PAS domain S-box protein [Desulfohalobiaceae bacterium]|nr:PAS domain S-box protein [Desulfohalobiaceae bacterium]
MDKRCLNNELEKRVAGRTAVLAEENQRLKAEIAAQQTAIQELKESEEQYRFITERMADIVWIIDLDFRDRYVSPSNEKVLGFSPEEWQQRRFEDKVTPESLARIMERFARELEADGKEGTDPDRAIRIEVEYYHHNGSTVWLENVAKAIRDTNGTIIGIHGVSRDISEKKQAKDALEKERHRLEHAISQVKQLSGLLPICAHCKKIRDDQGYWSQIESYIQNHSDANFSHSICPECAREHYPDMNLYK